MDPNPKNFPILSHILNRTFSFGSPGREQPPERDDSAIQSEFVIKDPKMLAAMKHATADVVQTRSVLQALGPRPDHEAVDAARVRIAEVDATMAKTLAELAAMPRPSTVEDEQWRMYLAKEERQIRDAIDKEKGKYKAVISLEEMHKSYEKLLREAEDKLTKIYETGEPLQPVSEQEAKAINEAVVKSLEEAMEKKLDRVDLSGRKMGVLPPSFSKIQGLVVLDISNNQLKVIPDVVSELEKLTELYASSNLLESLPDSLGKLKNLKILNVSGNKLTSVPDSICSCKSLIELDVSFNNLLYLPTNIGLELVNLQKLSFHLNKIRSLPSSVCEMKCLKHLDGHFNEIRGLPSTFGKLTNLEVLNLSNNFADLKDLPESICELSNLKELDLSNNQIRILPDRFGLLENLSKLNLEHNPIEIPPQSIAKAGAETVKAYMVKRRLDMLLQEEEKSMHEMQEREQVEQGGWLTRSTSWLKTKVTDVGGNVADYLGTVGNTGDPVIDAPR